MLPDWRHRAKSSDEALFRDFILNGYFQAKNALSKIGAHNTGTADELEVAQNALFVFAAGSFSYGNIDSASDLLLNIIVLDSHLDRHGFQWVEGQF